MENLKVIEKHFKIEMKNKNFEEFKKTHPTLLNVIIKSMDEKYISAIKDVMDYTKGFREYNHLQAELNKIIDKQLKSK